MKLYVVLQADSTIYGADNLVGIYKTRKEAEEHLPKGRGRSWYGITEWDTKTQKGRMIDIAVTLKPAGKAGFPREGEE